MKHLKLFEAFVGGINYDQQSEISLKREVGNLENLTPYLLEYGNRIISDGEMFDIYQDDKLVKKGIPLEEFLTKYCKRPYKLK